MFSFTFQTEAFCCWKKKKVKNFSYTEEKKKKDCALAFLPAAASVKSRQARQSKPDSCGLLLLSALNILFAPKTAREQGPREDGGADVRDFRRCGIVSCLALANGSVPSALTSQPRRSILRDAPARKLPPNSSSRGQLVCPRGERARGFCGRRSLSVMNSSESRALGTLNIKRGHSSLYLVIARVKPADGFFALMHRASPSRR